MYEHIRERYDKVLFSDDAGHARLVNDYLPTPFVAHLLHNLHDFYGCVREFIHEFLVLPRERLNWVF